MGTMADVVGAPAVVATASSVAMVAGLLVAIFVPRIRNLRLSQIAPQMP